MNVPQREEDRLFPVYAEHLSKYDPEIMSETLYILIESWDKGKLPTVGEIIEQYKLLVTKKQRQRRPNPEPEATTTANLFWETFKACKKAGITDINEIADKLQKMTGTEPIKTTCTDNVCDGKGFLVAIRKDDAGKCETLFRCKCNNVAKIEMWDYQKDFLIIKGLAEKPAVNEETPF